jgi:hypothetical protein
MTKKLLALLSFAIFVLSASHTSYAAMEPDNVAAVVSRAAAECRGMGGQPNTDAMLSVDDLNGDGGEDWIVDFSKFGCSGGANSFCGSAGCSLQIFFWSSGSTWRSVFDGVVQQYRLLRVQGRRGIEMSGRGNACGKSNAQTCRKTYIFGAKGLIASR